MSPIELARRTGISTDTLRYYERRGVLPRPARTANGYRRYSEDDMARVLLVCRALAAGFSVADLSLVLRERDRGGAPCRKVHALVMTRVQALGEELAALAQLKGDLERLLSDWDERLARTPAGAQARLLDTLPPLESTSSNEIRPGGRLKANGPLRTPRTPPDLVGPQ